MPRELTIGELSARSGVSQSALRFYERKGLIAAERSSGNQRRYPPSRCGGSRSCRRAAPPGSRCSASARRSTRCPRDRPPTKRDWERLSRSWRAELDERIATLEGIRGRLTGCIGCGCLSLRRCALLNPGDEAAHDGPGAHYLVAPSSGSSTRGPRSGA